MIKLRLFLIIFILTIFPFNINAQTKVQGYVERGGKTIQTSSTISHKVQGSYPNSTVTVKLHGTSTLATLGSDESMTPKSNPFNADSNGYYFFYIEEGRYDLTFSGSGISIPFTHADLLVEQSGSSFLIDPKASPYNAKCDGVTDDTVAFNTAFTAAPNGSTVIIPVGQCIVTGPAATSIFTITKSLNIIGLGSGSMMLFKTGTPTNVTMFHLRPPPTGAVGPPSGTVGTIAGINNNSFQFSNFTIAAQTPGEGGIAILTDIYASGSYMELFDMNKMRIYPTGSWSYEFRNNNGAGAGNELNGSQQVRIRDNVFWNGMKALYASDTWDIEHNAFREGDNGIEIAFGSGVSGFNFSKNVVVAKGGMNIRNGFNVIIRDNYFEAYVPGTAGTNSAYLNLSGDIGQIQGAVITGNNFTALNGLLIDMLRIDNATNVSIISNYYPSITPTRNSIVTTVSAAGVYSCNNFGAATAFQSHSTGSLQQCLTSFTSPFKFTGHSGVTNFQTDQLTMGTNPATFGDFRVKNGFTIYSRNAANNNNFEVLATSSDDGVNLGNGGNVVRIMAFGGTLGGRIEIQPRTFENLGTPVNGTMSWCSNCTEADPCATGGTGSFAKRQNSRWKCN
jgi:hypothetical protein